MDESLDYVSTGQRMDFVQRELEGLTTEEICAILGRLTH